MVTSKYLALSIGDNLVDVDCGAQQVHWDHANLCGTHVAGIRNFLRGN